MSQPNPSIRSNSPSSSSASPPEHRGKSSAEVAQARLWALLRELVSLERGPALHGVSRAYDQLMPERMFVTVAAKSFPTVGSNTTGGCSKCDFNFTQGINDMVLDAAEARRILGVMLFVIDANEARYSFESPQEAVAELNSARQVRWVLPASAAEMAAPPRNAWVRFAFDGGEELTETVNIVQDG
jgi:hypothetical protein